VNLRYFSWCQSKQEKLAMADYLGLIPCPFRICQVLWVLGDVSVFGGKRGCAGADRRAPVLQRPAPWFEVVVLGDASCFLTCLFCPAREGLGRLLQGPLLSKAGF